MNKFPKILNKTWKNFKIVYKIDMFLELLNNFKIKLLPFGGSKDGVKRILKFLLMEKANLSLKKLLSEKMGSF